MSPLLLRSARRFYLRHPWQLLLAIAGIGLGVAVYVGVDLANDSARRAFELSADTVRGRTTHRLLPVGAGLPETVYRDLLLAGRVDRAAPVVEAAVRAGGPFGPRLTLLGIDPIKEGDFRDYSRFAPLAAAGSGTTRLLTEAGAVLIPETLAEALGLSEGSAFTLWIDGRAAAAQVAGIVPVFGGGAEAAAPIVADIATAQRLLGRPGIIDRIDLALGDAERERLAAALPDGTALVASDRETGGLAEMMRAFRINLTALGLLALVVGMFLIYSMMSFAIVQRRPVIGILRAIGTERRVLLEHVLLEALAIGAVGSLAGLALGHLLARGLVEMVLQTIGDLYFSRSVGAVAASPWIYLQGAVLGLGATLIAALGPAIEAARAEPEATLRRAALERKARGRIRLAAWLSLPTLAVAALLLGESRSLAAAFTGLFLVLCAGAMLTPSVTIGLMKIVAPLLGRGFGLPGLMAVRGVGASLSRTGVATAALAVAVATVVGIGLMIGSFRSSLSDWIDTTLTADLYLSADGGEAGAFDAGQVAAIAAVPGVRGLGLTRFVGLPTEYGELGLRAQQPGPDGWGIDIVGGDPAQAIAGLVAADRVAVAEPFAYRYGFTAGDRITLPTAGGPHAFEIAGIYRDYNAGGSVLTADLATYRKHWRDTSLTGIGVHLEPGADEAAATAAIRAAIGGAAGRIRSTAAIKDLSLQIFDRTFRITEVLRLLAGLIAFLGVLSAVLAIQLERAREIAVLRGLGFTPRELATQILAQTGLLGLAAGVAAAPLGIALAALLVNVINRRSFGWSMDLSVDAVPLLGGLALAVGAALLAGIYPAARTSRLQVAAAIRDE